MRVHDIHYVRLPDVTVDGCHYCLRLLASGCKYRRPNTVCLDRYLFFYAAFYRHMPEWNINFRHQFSPVRST